MLDESMSHEARTERALSHATTQPGSTRLHQRDQIVEKDCPSEEDSLHHQREYNHYLREGLFNIGFDRNFCSGFSGLSIH
jgi:hypothetical protein